MKTRVAAAVAAVFATSACGLSGSHFRPNYSGPREVMLRLAAAARQCGYGEVHIGPPFVRAHPDDIGVRIDWMGEGRKWDCLMQWSRESGVDIGRYSIIVDRAPGTYPPYD